MHLSSTDASLAGRSSTHPGSSRAYSCIRAKYTSCGIANLCMHTSKLLYFSKGTAQLFAYLRTRPGSEQSSRAIMGGKPSAATSSEAASSDLASLPKARMAPFLVASACDMDCRRSTGEAVPDCAAVASWLGACVAERLLGCTAVGWLSCLTCSVVLTLHPRAGHASCAMSGRWNWLPSLWAQSMSIGHAEVQEVAARTWNPAGPAEVLAAPLRSCHLVCKCKQGRACSFPCSLSIQA